MIKPFGLLTRIGESTGALGALVSAMGCAMCFPAIASLGAAIGLGFLSHWEGLFVNTLLPAFAWLALVINALGWLSHRSEEHTSELQSLMRISYAVFCLKKNTSTNTHMTKYQTL